MLGDICFLSLRISGWWQLFDKHTEATAAEPEEGPHVLCGDVTRLHSAPERGRPQASSFPDMKCSWEPEKTFTIILKDRQMSTSSKVYN